MHYVPDTLSRMFEEEDPKVSAISRTHGSKDQWYVSRFSEVRNNPSNFPRWKIVGGQLYHYVADVEIEDEIGIDDNTRKLVIRKERVQQILKECHDVPTAGHPGRDKTIRRVSESYFWPRMRKDVARYVRSCKVCQQHKVE